MTDYFLENNVKYMIGIIIIYISTVV